MPKGIQKKIVKECSGCGRRIKAIKVQKYCKKCAKIIDDLNTKDFNTTVRLKKRAKKKLKCVICKDDLTYIHWAKKICDNPDCAIEYAKKMCRANYRKNRDKNIAQSIKWNYDNRERHNYHARMSARRRKGFQYSHE